MPRAARPVDLVLAVADGSAPLRHRLADAVVAELRAGRLRPGDALPSTRALAASLGLSRGPVVAAYDELAAAGFVVSRAGSGAVVAPAPTGQRQRARSPTCTRHATRHRPEQPFGPGPLGPAPRTAGHLAGRPGRVAARVAGRGSHRARQRRRYRAGRTTGCAACWPTTCAAAVGWPSPPTTCSSCLGSAPRCGRCRPHSTWSAPPSRSRTRATSRPGRRSRPSGSGWPPCRSTATGSTPPCCRRTPRPPTSPPRTSTRWVPGCR